MVEPILYSDLFIALKLYLLFLVVNIRFFPLHVTLSIRSFLRNDLIKWVGDVRPSVLSVISIFLRLCYYMSYQIEICSVILINCLYNRSVADF